MSPVDKVALALRDEIDRQAGRKRPDYPTSEDSTVAEGVIDLRALAHAAISAVLSTPDP